jgi:hypothetical protein
MSGNRGTRKEDRSSMVIAQILEHHARKTLTALCLYIEEIPEIAKLKRTPRVSAIEWQQFITTLAHKALAGEEVERVLHEFNRLYVFPLRKKNHRA